MPSLRTTFYELLRGLIGIGVLVGLACALVWTLEHFGLAPH